MSFFKTDGTDLEIKTKLKASKVIFPAIAIGNVPQLTVDLLIHNYDFKLIANLDSTFLYPFASPVDFTDGRPVDGLSTALQLYYNEELKLSVVQQRSPVLPSYSKNYLDYLVQFITEIGFEEVIVLDSNDFGYQVNATKDENVEIYSNRIDDGLKNLNVSQTLENDELKFTRFSATLIQLLKDQLKETNITGIVSFVYEGDNFYDAEFLSRKVLTYLEIKQVEHFKKPQSWEGVYGDRPIPSGFDEGIYA